jgi:hypothetical protein
MGRCGRRGATRSFRRSLLDFSRCCRMFHGDEVEGDEWGQANPDKLISDLMNPDLSRRRRRRRVQLKRVDCTY